MNDPQTAELTYCSDNLAETGEMTECISVILATSTGKLFGVHCGGGICEDWVETICNSRLLHGERVVSVIAVFGCSYQNEVEYLNWKFDLVRNITEHFNAVCCFVSSANLKIGLENNQLYFTGEYKLWTPTNQ